MDIDSTRQGEQLDPLEEPTAGHLDASQILGVCPDCEGNEFLTETEVDEDGVPTGTFIVTCATCGSELGRLPPLPPSAEAEPEPEEESLLSGPSEEPRSESL